MLNSLLKYDSSSLHPELSFKNVVEKENFLDVFIGKSANLLCLGCRYLGLRKMNVQPSRVRNDIRCGKQNFQEFRNRSRLRKMVIFQTENFLRLKQDLISSPYQLDFQRIFKNEIIHII
jgi:hypothetical protein